MYHLLFFWYLHLKGHQSYHWLFLFMTVTISYHKQSYLQNLWKNTNHKQEKSAIHYREKGIRNSAKTVPNLSPLISWNHI